MNRIRIATVDVLAIIGLACLSAGVALVTVPAAALIVIGTAVLLYAILASRSEVTP